MTIQPIADLDGLKTRIRVTWMAGDYSSVAALTQAAANDFIDSSVAFADDEAPRSIATAAI